jgi:chromosome segregation ATPase
MDAMEPQIVQCTVKISQLKAEISSYMNSEQRQQFDAHADWENAERMKNPRFKLRLYELMHQKKLRKRLRRQLLTGTGDENLCRQKLKRCRLKILSLTIELNHIEIERQKTHIATLTRRRASTAGEHSLLDEQIRTCTKRIEDVNAKIAERLNEIRHLDFEQ